MHKSKRDALRKVERKFAKINALGAAKTPEARRARRALSDLWVDRTPTNVTGFRKPGKPGKVVAVLGL